jgi:hypothetical protein
MITKVSRPPDPPPPTIWRPDPSPRRLSETSSDRGLEAEAAAAAGPFSYRVVLRCSYRREGKDGAS